MTRRRTFLPLFLASLATFPTLSRAQPPAKCSSRAVSACSSKWKTYTKNLLSELFPNDSTVINNLVLVVIPDTEPNASAHRRDTAIVSDRDTLRISLGLFEAADQKGEYAYVISHELGHLLLGHEPTRHVDWFTVVENFELMEEQEMAADRFAINALAPQGFSPCSGLSFIEKLIVRYNTRDDPTDPYNAIGLKRETQFQEACQAFKRMHDPPQ